MFVDVCVVLEELNSITMSSIQFIFCVDIPKGLMVWVNNKLSGKEIVLLVAKDFENHKDLFVVYGVTLLFDDKFFAKVGIEKVPLGQYSSYPDARSVTSNFKNL